MILDPSVVAALVAAFGAVALYSLGQRRAAIERKRRACAEAMADALAWLELPYRIRRRVNDDAEALNSLAERINHLRERLNFHEKWLRVEIPSAHPYFRSLLREVRSVAGPVIEDAWRFPPVQAASDMNIGRLDIRLDQVETAVEGFSSEVTKNLVWWRILS